MKYPGTLPPLFFGFLVFLFCILMAGGCAGRGAGDPPVQVKTSGTWDMTMGGVKKF
jgi:hypothetical protein